MKEAGYPIKTEFFILILVILIAVAFYSSLESLMLGDIGRAIGNLFRLLLFTIVPLNLYLGGKVRARQNKIRLQLCNVQDIMYFQTKIGTPDDVILTYAAKAVASPLREALQYIANAPKVKKSLEKALEGLRNLSSITEIQAFSFALAQKHEMGVSEQNFKAQANLLKRSKRLRKKIIRQYKRTKLMIAAVLLFFCYILLAAVPIIQEVFRNLDIMFR